MLFVLLSMFTAVLAVNQTYEFNNPDTKNKTTKNSKQVEIEVSNNISSSDSEDEKQNTGCFCWRSKPKCKRKSCDSGTYEVTMNIQPTDDSLSGPEGLINSNQRIYTVKNYSVASTSSSSDYSEGSEGTNTSVSNYAYPRDSTSRFARLKHHENIKLDKRFLKILKKTPMTLWVNFLFSITNAVGYTIFIEPKQREEIINNPLYIAAITKYRLFRSFRMTLDFLSCSQKNTENEQIMKLRFTVLHISVKEKIKIYLNTYKCVQYGEKDVQDVISTFVTSLTEFANIEKFIAEIETDSPAYDRHKKENTVNDFWKVTYYTCLTQFISSEIYKKYAEDSNKLQIWASIVRQMYLDMMYPWFKVKNPDSSKGHAYNLSHNAPIKHTYSDAFYKDTIDFLKSVVADKEVLQESKGEPCIAFDIAPYLIGYFTDNCSEINENQNFTDKKDIIGEILGFLQVENKFYDTIQKISKNFIGMLTFYIFNYSADVAPLLSFIDASEEKVQIYKYKIAAITLIFNSYINTFTNTFLITLKKKGKTSYDSSSKGAVERRIIFSNEEETETLFSTVKLENNLSVRVTHNGIDAHTSLQTKIHDEIKGFVYFCVKNQNITQLAKLNAICGFEPKVPEKSDKLCQNELQNLDLCAASTYQPTENAHKKRKNNDSMAKNNCKGSLAQNKRRSDSRQNVLSRKAQSQVLQVVQNSQLEDLQLIKTENEDPKSTKTDVSNDEKRNGQEESLSNEDKGNDQMQEAKLTTTADVFNPKNAGKLHLKQLLSKTDNDREKLNIEIQNSDIVSRGNSICLGIIPLNTCEKGLSGAKSIAESANDDTELPSESNSTAHIRDNAENPLNKQRLDTGRGQRYQNKTHLVLEEGERNSEYTQRFTEDQNNRSSSFVRPIIEKPNSNSSAEQVSQLEEISKPITDTKDIAVSDDQTPFTPLTGLSIDTDVADQQSDKITQNRRGKIRQNQMPFARETEAAVSHEESPQQPSSSQKTMQHTNSKSSLQDFVIDDNYLKKEIAKLRNHCQLVYAIDDYGNMSRDSEVFVQFSALHLNEMLNQEDIHA